MIGPKGGVTCRPAPGRLGQPPPDLVYLPYRTSLPPVDAATGGVTVPGRQVLSDNFYKEGSGSQERSQGDTLRREEPPHTWHLLPKASELIKTCM